ncbi:MAG TPA: BlaI/MecI/CopY family transcriptional regulator [Sumerlaeia bacterium]|nr:BlaI/MecI/CopY family transcriptional regulator [Sumerlaeia bacterium]
MAGKSKRPELSQAEWTVMKRVWELGKTNVREVYEDLRDSQGWAYNTVRTMMERLRDKGCLTVKKVGNTHLPRISHMGSLAWPRNCHGAPMKSAFTLIELLIVVAIIAILAAIAVPNFLEAQIRARVSRVTADIRTLATALEAYCVDHNDYPPVLPDGYYSRLYIEYNYQLTTPVSYITSVALTDPFQPKNGAPVEFAHAIPDTDWIGSYNYFRYNNFWAIGCFELVYLEKGFALLSHGPSLEWSGIEMYPYIKTTGNPYLKSGLGLYHEEDSVYNPTNGTKSHGGIARFGGLGGVEVQVGA